MDQTVVFNPACQAIAFVTVHAIHTYYLGFASEEQHILTTPGQVGGDGQVTFNVLTRSQPFLQDAIESIFAQIFRFGWEWMRAADAGHIYRPL
jgi:hypothetical protein